MVALIYAGILNLRKKSSKGRTGVREIYLCFPHSENSHFKANYVHKINGVVPLIEKNPM